MSNEGDPKDPKSGRDEDAREAILARRRQFLTYALASTGVVVAAEGCESSKPQPCLDIAPPQVCLSPVEPDPPKDAGAPPTDAGGDVTDAGGGATDAGAGDGDAAAGDGDAAADGKRDAGTKPKPPPPRPCLRVKQPPRPPPKPCLSPPPPPEKKP